MPNTEAGCRMKRRSTSKTSLFVLCWFLAAYIWLWFRLSSSASSSVPALDTPLASPSKHSGSASTNYGPYSVPESKRGKTLIVAFCNFHFRAVGVAWYERMTRLGYDNHLLVATDPPMIDFLKQQPTPLRYHVWIHEPLPDYVNSWPRHKQDHACLELLMAVRWKYLLKQLESGYHIVLTDADNIFTRFIDVDVEVSDKDPETDVWHAYATKFPRKSFQTQGFCVCSGMSWWRSSPGAIRFARVMQENCGDMCDDQRELNSILSTSNKLNMTWVWTEKARQSLLSNGSTTDPRFIGLPTVGISGYSDITGHKAKIWDRDFAFRGPLLPDICPIGNWVSMPILDAKSRQSAWKAKIESFHAWDQHCMGKTR